MKHNSIDTEVWITQLALANELRVSIQVVHNWVRRGKLETVKLPGSRIRLVNRLQGISLKHY
jgi:predicted site-specific integrase-resolvase